MVYKALVWIQNGMKLLGRVDGRHGDFQEIATSNMLAASFFLRTYEKIYIFAIA